MLLLSNFYLTTKLVSSTGSTGPSWTSRPERWFCKYVQNNIVGTTSRNCVISVVFVWAGWSRGWRRHRGAWITWTECKQLIAINSIFTFIWALKLSFSVFQSSFANPHVVMSQKAQVCLSGLLSTPRVLSPPSEMTSWPPPNPKHIFRILGVDNHSRKIFQLSWFFNLSTMCWCRNIFSCFREPMGIPENLDPQVIP